MARAQWDAQRHPAPYRPDEMLVDAAGDLFTRFEFAPRPMKLRYFSRCWWCTRELQKGQRCCEPREKNF
nr:hypothetical protein [Paraburkholderia sp. BL8N3]